MKQKIIRWLVSLLDDEYMLVRKERITSIARMVNGLEKSKIATLSLIRLDGSTLAQAIKVWENWNGRPYFNR